MDNLEPIIPSNEDKTSYSITKEELFEDDTITDSLNESGESINLKDIRVITDESLDNGYVLGVSILGRSHKEKQVPCQDFHMFRDCGNGWHVFVLSDGAGSAKLSEFGSQKTCQTVLNYVCELISEKQWNEKNYEPTELEWYIEIRSIFEKTKLYFRDIANMSDFATEKDYSSTIMVCVKTPSMLLSAHIGDGRMGYRDEDCLWHSLIVPHKGEEANQTIFLQNSWTVPSVPALKIRGSYVPETRIVHDTASCVVLMSDGCEMAAWECVIWNSELGKYEDLNNPYPRFLDPLVNTLEDTPREEKILALKEIMDCGTEACRKERDDKTILIGIY